MYDIISGNLGWILVAAVVWAGARQSRRYQGPQRRNRPPRFDPSNNRYRSFDPYNQNQPPLFPPPPVPPTPPPYTQPFQPGFPPPTYNLPPTGTDPNQPSAGWPEPVVPQTNSRVLSATPPTTAPDLTVTGPTKDVFVWGQTVSGWVYAGKLTVARNLRENEIRQYADGKFGMDLHNKLCIEADNFEQARYIFEESQTF